MSNTRRALVFVLLVGGILSITAIDVVVGTGGSMEPRYEDCDILFVDTIRDTASAVNVHDVIAYRTGSGLIVHQVIGVAPSDDYVWARGLNRETRDRVTSEMLVGVVVGHLDTSEICALAN